MPLKKKPSHSEQVNYTKIIKMQEFFKKALPAADFDKAAIRQIQWQNMVKSVDEHQWKRLGVRARAFLIDKFLDKEQKEILFAKRKNSSRWCHNDRFDVYHGDKTKWNNKRKRQYKEHLIDKSSNQLLIEKGDFTPKKKRKISHLNGMGVSCKKLTRLNQPQSKLVCAKSPGSTEYKLISDIGGLSFFKKKTPIKQISNTIWQKKSRNNTTSYRCNNKTEIKFTVTKDKIGKRQGTKRGISQRTLVGCSSRDIFKFHGLNVEFTNSSNVARWHLSHIIAYVLGGEHDYPNITPTSAAANYTTLQLVERPCIEKLINAITEAIDISVNIDYENGNDIATVIDYQLTWKERCKGTLEKKERVQIYPQSHTKLNHTEKQSLNLARQLQF
jgi:hypothetical protein